MTKYFNLIFLSILSLVFYYFTGNVSTLDFDSYLELIGGLFIFGMIVYNEIRQNRQLSVIDLISLREEIHQLSAQFMVLEEKLEHRAYRNEFLEFKLELNNQVEELSSALHSQVNNLVDVISANQGVEDEYYEEEKVEQTPKKSRKKK
jgi:hypothetical protein